MSHYDQRLQDDLDTIRAAAVDIGERVVEAIRLSVQAIIDGDRALAGQVVLGDHPINRDVRSLDKACHLFVARHLPSAGHLRFVSSVLRLDIGLERVGDYAVAVARESLHLTTPIPPHLANELRAMSERATEMLEQAMLAWATEKPDLARGTKLVAGEVDSDMERAFAALLEYGDTAQAAPLRDLFALLIAFNRIERVSDQAKNICEEAIFATTGETKPPKQYKILFVDERNASISVLAETFARRAFPESGLYTSQGWNPADAVDPRALALIDERGMDAPAAPKPLGTLREELDDYHVIVSFTGDLRDKVPEIPFQTLVVEWNIGTEAEVEASDDALRECFSELAVHVRDLMVTLRGAEAT